MLGSAFDGERLNALGMLQRLADSYRVPIHELLLDGTVGIGPRSARERAERAEREAGDANLRAQRAEQAAREAKHARPADPIPRRRNCRRIGKNASSRRRNSIAPRAS